LAEIKEVRYTPSKEVLNHMEAGSRNLSYSGWNHFKTQRDILRQVERGLFSQKALYAYDIVNVGDQREN